MNFFTSFGDPHIEGLLKSTLCDDMFWHARKFMQRRLPFPSWSCAGWKGEMRMPRVTREVHFLSTFVSWYAWDDESNGYELLVTNENFLRLVEDSEVDTPDVAKSAQRKFAVLAVIWHEMDASKGPDTQPYHESDIVRVAMAHLARLAYPQLPALPRHRPRLPKQGLDGPGTLLFRTFTATVWISARASNGELARPSDEAGSTRHDTYVPALYLYSASNAGPEMLGIAWVTSEIEYSRIRKKTISMCPDIDDKDVKADELCLPLMAVSRDYDDPPWSADRRAEVEAIFERFGTRPHEAVHALPTDPDLRAKFTKSRKIEKVKIAFISGPIEGDYQRRKNVPMSFPNGATRAFYRVLLLVEHITQKDTAEPSYHYERLGTGELERCVQY
jgi:hypothetical protein